MSRILIIGEHDGQRLNIATAKCVRCAEAIGGDVDIALFGNGIESVAAEASRLVARDQADSTRDLSPLRRAPDALEIDTTSLEPAEVVEAIVRLAHERGARGGVG